MTGPLIFGRFLHLTSSVSWRGSSRSGGFSSRFFGSRGKLDALMRPQLRLPDRERAP
jgi:hypothetical protein